MSGISSSRRVAEAQGKWRSLSAWIENLYGTLNDRVLSKDENNRPRLRILQQHGYSMPRIADTI